MGDKIVAPLLAFFLIRMYSPEAREDITINMPSIPFLTDFWQIMSNYVSLGTLFAKKKKSGLEPSATMASCHTLLIYHLHPSLHTQTHHIMEQDECTASKSTSHTSLHLSAQSTMYITTCQHRCLNQEWCNDTSDGCWHKGDAYIVQVAPIYPKRCQKILLWEVPTSYELTRPF